MSSVYVMVNTDEVPSILKEFVDIFTLFDSIRYIVGYCLPLKLYVEFYGNAEASRVIKAIKDDKEVELYKENHDLYKVSLKLMTGIFKSVGGFFPNIFYKIFNLFLFIKFSRSFC